jgi:SAM-dependent methyltransferase
MRLSQLVRADVDELPCPPEHYMYRVSHVRNAHTFRVGGLKTLGDFFEPFARHRDIARTRSILDWGCGFGRMAMFLLAAGDCPEFSGCDIDREAVAWCHQHLRSGAFSVIDLLPPTPYHSAQFDFICSYSVLTHLTRETQREWLKEMHRLLAPGGLFIATTHGRLAYSFARRKLSVRFPLGGIVDKDRDDTLGAVVPAGYYRSTYQSRRHTLREFGRFFSILEYVERGAGNFQDLIVVTK